MKIKLIIIFLFLSSSLFANDEFVILLHGIGRTNKSMKKIEKALIKDGYIVKNINYSSTKKNISSIVENELKEVVQDCIDKKANKIHFVTHSMGGIVVRYFLQNNKIPKNSNIVMLSPPNNGSEISDHLKDWYVYKKIYGPAGQELGKEKSGILNELKPIKDCNIGIIAGNKSIEPWFSFLLSGKDDGKVAVESTKLEEMTDFIVFHDTHTFIMYDKKVINEIRHFLKYGKFEHNQ